MWAYFDDATELASLERPGDPEERFPERSLVELHDEPDPGRMWHRNAAQDLDVGIPRLDDRPPGVEHVTGLDDHEERQPSASGVALPPGAAHRGVALAPLFGRRGGDHDALRDCEASGWKHGILIGLGAQRGFATAAARTMLSI